MVELILKLLAGFIIILIIIGVTLATKLLEEDHKKKTRGYRLYEEEKRMTNIQDKNSFQSYRDNDRSYQEALRAVQGLRIRDDKDKDGGGLF